VGGFRFNGSQEEVERIIGKWRSTSLGQNSSLKREKIQYQGHEIEVAKTGSFSIATTYDPPWFFVATDAGEMHALLDRTDRRATRTRRIEQPFRVCLPTTWHSFICNRERSRNGSRHCALRSDQPQLPERAHCSRKCVVLPARCDSKTEECTTYFSWICRSWNR